MRNKSAICLFDLEFRYWDTKASSVTSFLQALQYSQAAIHLQNYSLNNRQNKIPFPKNYTHCYMQILYVITICNYMIARSTEKE